jgi:hypothetical protein
MTYNLAPEECSTETEREETERVVRVGEMVHVCAWKMPCTGRKQPKVTERTKSEAMSWQITDADRAPD